MLSVDTCILLFQIPPIQVPPITMHQGHPILWTTSLDRSPNSHSLDRHHLLLHHNQVTLLVLLTKTKLQTMPE